MKYLIGNHKMNFNKSELTAYLKELKKVAKQSDNYVAVCVPYVYLPLVQKMCKKSKVHYGAQNMYYQPKGTYTGEISATMLKDFDTELVILGHSERRATFCETDELINNKLITALNEGFTPILCIGETSEEREAKLTNKVLKKQLTGALKNVEVSALNKILFAYEPVWAISTGAAVWNSNKKSGATKEDAEKAIKYVKQTIAKIYGLETTENIVVLYGGSLNSKNMDDLLAQPSIDGGLIGGASLKVEEFAKVIKYKG